MKKNKSLSVKVGRGGDTSKSVSVKPRLHFIPNSHLDREWGMDFQQTRKLTVDFLDSLLDIFKKVKQYTFLLDSQTVPLEDYLEVRPENKNLLKKYVKDKRLFIGPWYSAPDCFTISGESIVRNLLIGHKIAEEFGGVMKVGYTPFGFGQISQLPQIYQSFGIDTALFYRGITKDESPSAEFKWESPDGTTVLCSRFGIGARYNFFFYIWRPVLQKGKMLIERIADWTEGGLPFKFIDKENQYENYWMPKANYYFEKDRIIPCFRNLIEKEKQQFLTPAIALMAGMDTSAPEELEAEIIKYAQKELKDEADIIFSNLPDYIDELKKVLKQGKYELKTFKGEMRNPGAANFFTSINSEVVSARPKQKQLAKKAETYLQRWAEPFAAIASLYGDKYPQKFLEIAWKYLLKCHAHDTVGGCGIDDVQCDAEYRLRQVVNISKFIRRDAIQSIQKLITNANVADNEIIITVFNPMPIMRTEVVKAFVDIPSNLNICHVRIYDTAGNEVSIYEGARRHTEKVLRANGDAANSFLGEELEVLFLAENVPAFGYKTYILRGGEHSPLIFPHIALDARTLENEFLKVIVNSDSSLNITDKQSNKTYYNSHIFEDGGDAGDPWNYHAPSRDRGILSSGYPVEISLIENSHLSATIKVALTMNIPADIGHDDDHHLTWRLDETKPLKIISYITLKKNSPLLEFETHVENNSKNHRLRVLFPTELKTDYSNAEQAFDVVSRIIPRDTNHPYRFTFNPPAAMLRFVDLSEKDKGFSILTKGIHEYEAKDDEKRTIALTLLRCFEVTLCTVSYRWERLPEMELSQSLGRHIFHYAIYLHKNSWDKANVLEWTDRYHLPMLPAQTTKYEGKKLEQNKSFLELNPSSVCISAIKKCENTEGLILRLYNPLDTAQKTSLKFGFDLKNAYPVTPEEKPIRNYKDFKVKNNSIEMIIEKKKFVSIKIVKK